MISLQQICPIRVMSVGTYHKGELMSIGGKFYVSREAHNKNPISTTIDITLKQFA